MNKIFFDGPTGSMIPICILSSITKENTLNTRGPLKKNKQMGCRKFNDRFFYPNLSSPPSFLHPLPIKIKTYKGVCHKLYKQLISQFLVVSKLIVIKYVMLCYVIVSSFNQIVKFLQVILFKVFCVKQVCYVMRVCYVISRSK